MTTWCLIQSIFSFSLGSRFEAYRPPQSSEDDVTADSSKGRKLRGTEENSQSDTESYIIENVGSDEKDKLQSTSKPVRPIYVHNISFFHLFSACSACFERMLQTWLINFDNKRKNNRVQQFVMEKINEYMCKTRLLHLIESR